METITVNAKALRSLLNAVTGNPYEVRELQATRNPLVDPENPINVLVGEFNAAVDKFNGEQSNEKP